MAKKKEKSKIACHNIILNILKLLMIYLSVCVLFFKAISYIEQEQTYNNPPNNLIFNDFDKFQR